MNKYTLLIKIPCKVDYKDILFADDMEEAIKDFQRRGAGEYDAETLRNNIDEEEILPCPNCTDGNLEFQKSKFHNGQGEPESKTLACNMCNFKKEVL